MMSVHCAKACDEGEQMRRMRPRYRGRSGEDFEEGFGADHVAGDEPVDLGHVLLLLTEFDAVGQVLDDLRHQHQASPALGRNLLVLCWKDEALISVLNYIIKIGSKISIIKTLKTK
jgi:hypothetical protein